MSAVTLAEAAPATRGRRPLGGLGWVTWRQHRLALGGSALLLGGVGAFLLFTGLAMHHQFAALGLTNCGDLTGDSCQAAFQLFQQHWQALISFLPHFLLFLPGVLGLFVGAPLVAREIESGTFRFAWTQGPSRRRWIVTKLVLLGLVLTAMALAFSLVYSWWFGPWVRIEGRMQPGQAYELVGVVFAARTLFAFALGALAGTIIRRSIPAMAATAAVWFAAVYSSVIWLRPHIEKPIVSLAGSNGFAIRGGVPNSPTDWVVDSWAQDAAGHRLSQTQFLDLVRQATRGQGPVAVAGNGGSFRVELGSPDRIQSYLASHGVTQWISYHPAARFWHFQGVEAAGYVLVALACAAATVWLVHRRGA